ncbi:MAG TPA: outer membrane lipoprotein-sorting protein [Oligoflexia bacterium]|nr:outer membrane lipoprotein-sorting protein [Oligoflexia bacterium]HMP48076.1 outer membrane lipoprotein-sorting protein [Oligoflexia bacterium]
MNRFLLSIFNSLILLCNTQNLIFAEEPDAKELVKRAVEHWRGISSDEKNTGAETRAMMQIVRPSYTSNLELHAFTGGRKNSLVRFTAPPKDAGNATLMRGDEVWTYNPRTARVVKIPPSMKAQSWMGSDFSYQDLAKDDEIINQYDHVEIKRFEKAGRSFRVVKCTPHDNAPVVWGKEELEIRDDYIIEVHRYFDQKDNLVKTLTADESGMLGGRIYPIVMTMKNEETGNSTKITHTFADFSVILEDNFFSVTNLRRGR